MKHKYVVLFNGGLKIKITEEHYKVVREHIMQNGSIDGISINNYVSFSEGDLLYLKISDINCIYLDER